MSKTERKQQLLPHFSFPVPISLFSSVHLYCIPLLPPLRAQSTQRNVCVSRGAIFSLKHTHSVTHTHTNAHAHRHSNIYVNKHTYTLKQICRYTCTHSNTDTLIYAHTHPSTDIKYTHIYIVTQDNTHNQATVKLF